MADNHDDGRLSPRDRLKLLDRLAGIDSVTGLANRGAEQHIAGEISRAERQRAPLSCILLYVHQLTDVSDTTPRDGSTSSRLAADHVLSEVAGLLHRTVRAYDILFRWRAAEFLIVLPGVDLEEAQFVDARIRDEVAMSNSSGVGSLTVSSAVANMDDYDFNELLSRAARDLAFRRKRRPDLRAVPEVLPAAVRSHPPHPPYLPYPPQPAWRPWPL